ncbi:MAG TPA: EAL domain-containing protein [Thermoanaerobaculia bacterium]|nr:EAL domain-containing protein [Thermoanaerobaculia bacterium]
MSDVLEQMLAPDALSIHFQPIFEIGGTSTELWGFEALARGPKGTHFESAQILFDYVRLKREEARVDRRCIAEAIARASTFPDVPRVSLNVHASTLERDRGFATFLGSAAIAAAFDPASIVVEIVEQTQYYDATRFASALAELRSLGVQIAIDDFGLGNGNFRTILDVQPEFLKVDRYFVNHCARDANRQSLLRSVVQVARDFGSIVIAEGVEDADDLMTLSSLGVQLAQGFLLGRPQYEPEFSSNYAAPCRQTPACRRGSPDRNGQFASGPSANSGE